MKLVLHPPVEPERLEIIVAAAGPMSVVNTTTADEAADAILDADAFFGKITPKLLSRAPRLRWVQSPTASLEHYLFPELIEHPCMLTNMRGIFSDVIADHVLGYILCFARNLHIYLRQQALGRWEPVGGEAARATFATGPGMITAIDAAHLHLANQTVGIVGLGGIGMEVAKRAAAFRMRVLAVDAGQPEVPTAIESCWPVEQLPWLLRQSDFVVIATPHTPETERMFRRAQLEQMKPTAYLINVARGVIVDLVDLTAALQDGVIAGAALDVCEVEPLPAVHPLWTQENVIITPHIAAASPRIAQRHLELLIDNIDRFVNGQPLRNVVDKRKWY